MAPKWSTLRFLPCCDPCWRHHPFPSHPGGCGAPSGTSRACCGSYLEPTPSPSLTWGPCAARGDGGCWQSTQTLLQPRACPPQDLFKTSCSNENVTIAHRHPPLALLHHYCHCSQSCPAIPGPIAQCTPVPCPVVSWRCGDSMFASFAARGAHCSVSQLSTRGSSGRGRVPGVDLGGQPPA